MLTEADPRNEDGRSDEGQAPGSRTVGQSPMLLLRMKNGDEFAAPYPYLAWADYKPQDGITLEYPTRHVVIHGYGLEHLFRQIAEHKRTVVEEISSPSGRLATHENRARVTKIEITKPKKTKEEEDDTRGAKDING
jgi:hypothetical protein